MSLCSRRQAESADARKRQIEKSLRKVGGLAKAQTLLMEYNMLRQQPGMQMPLGASNLIEIKDFKAGDWKKLIDSMQLFYGLGRDTSGLGKSKKALWTLQEGAKLPYTIHNSEETIVATCANQYYAEAVDKGYSSFSNTSSVGYAVPGTASVSLSVGYQSSSSSESTQTSSGSTFYKVVQKRFIEAYFDINASGNVAYALSPSWTKDLAAVEATTDAANLPVRKALNLWAMFDDYGHMHPAKVSAGGKLHFTKTETKKEGTKETKEAQESGISVDVSAEAYGVQVGNKTETKDGSEKSSTEKNASQDSNSLLTKEGGDTNVKNVEDWITSINNADLWVPVKYDGIRHLTDALPKAEKDRVDAILKDPEVVKVFPDLQAWMLSQKFSEYFENRSVIIRLAEKLVQNNNYLALGAAGGADLDQGGVWQTCAFRTYGNVDSVDCVLWTTSASVGGQLQFTTNVTRVPGVLTASKDGSVFVDRSNRGNDPYQWWKIRSTKNGVYLLNMGSLTFLKPGTKKATFTGDKYAAIPDANNAFWLVPNSSSKLTPSKYDGTYYFETFDHSEEYDKIKQVFDNFWPLVSAWLDYLATEPLLWMMTMKAMKSSSMTLKMLLVDVDGNDDTYTKEYPINLAYYYEQLLDKAKVRQHIKDQCYARIGEWKDLVNEEEGAIEIMKLGYCCKFPYTGEVPSSTCDVAVAGAYPCAVQLMIPGVKVNEIVGPWDEKITISN